MFKTNVKNQLGSGIIEISIVIFLFTISFMYLFYSNKYRYSPISNEEISKIKDSCVINGLKDKFIENKINDNPLSRDELSYIKSYCERKKEEKMKNKNNQNTIREQEEILNTK